MVVKIGVVEEFFDDGIGVKIFFGGVLLEELDVVNRAKHILLNSNRSISEIAYGLGYEYPQSFTRLFKKKTGVSPLEFRTLH